MSGTGAESWPAQGRWAALAVALHGYYGALESALTRIARVLEGSAPAGSEWHKDLLRSMTLDLGDARPAVLSRASYEWLMKLLGFRHFFRHAYAVTLDGDELLAHARRVRSGHDALVGELSCFLDKLGTGDAKA